MPKETVTLRVNKGTRDALDAIAESLDRDRSYVANEALAAYVKTYEWQLAHIRQGLREANAGEFVPAAKVKKVLDRLRAK